MANKNKRSLEDAGVSDIKVGQPYYDSDGALAQNVILPDITVYGGNLNWRNNMKKDVSSYKDATRGYGRGGSRGYYDNKLAVGSRLVDRLSQYGAVKGSDGVYRFRNPNYKPSEDTELQQLKSDLGFGDNTDYEFLKWCAENANALNRGMGKPTTGDAWTRHGVYGDSVIIQAPIKKSDYHGLAKPQRYLSAQGKYIEDNIDNHELQTGDIVDLRYRGSNFTDTAWNTGDSERANTHTGTIIRTGNSKHDTFIAHSTGNGLRVEPIGNFIGSGIFKKSYITGIRRPGTKQHPYKKKDGGIYIQPSKRGTFSAAARNRGMGVQEFANKVLRNKDKYSPAMVKKANFARNASKWN